MYVTLEKILVAAEKAGIKRDEWEPVNKLDIDSESGISTIHMYGSDAVYVSLESAIRLVPNAEEKSEKELDVSNLTNNIVVLTLAINRDENELKVAKISFENDNYKDVNHITGADPKVDDLFTDEVKKDPEKYVNAVFAAYQMLCPKTPEDIFDEMKKYIDDNKELTRKLSGHEDADAVFEKRLGFLDAVKMIYECTHGSPEYEDLNTQLSAIIEYGEKVDYADGEESSAVE